MPELPWESLFTSTDAPERTAVRRGRLIRKQGRPLLFVPERTAAAVVAAALYPAQSTKARIARRLLQWLLRARAPVGSESMELRLPIASPFVSFLSQCAGTSEPPEFGILAGNPSTPGTRFIVLVFGSSGSPEAIVKAGNSAKARELLSAEQHFLEIAEGRFPEIPRRRAEFMDGTVQAFAMEYLYGDSPRAENVDEPGLLLRKWLHSGGRVQLKNINAWRRLRSAAPDLVAAELDNLPVTPAVFHGDFAPWNIKVSAAGAWMALDWERGELEGMPCWDWFHYVLQPAILVKRLEVHRLLDLAESLLKSSAFSEYCGQAGVTGNEKQLLKAYLGFCVHVLRPSQGLEKTQEFLRTFQ